MPNSPASVTDRPVISNASILILSGFLIQMALGESLTDDLSAYSLACGLTGLLAYIGLQLAAERRTKETREEEEAEVSRRLRKHVALPVSPPVSLAFDGDPVAEFFHETGLRAAGRQTSAGSGVQ